MEFLTAASNIAVLLLAPLAVYMLHELKELRRDVTTRIEEGERAIYQKIDGTDRARQELERRVHTEYVRREDVDARIEVAVLRTKDMVNDLRNDVHRIVGNGK